MIKDENYITIQGWMCSKLHLKGNSLLIYAIIYGFCQDDESCFHGSLNYLCEFTNSTRQGVINTLNDLVEHNLITKEHGFPNNKYKINVNLISEEVKSVYNEVNSVYPESKQSLQNNKDNTKENNKDNNTSNVEDQADSDTDTVGILVNNDSKVDDYVKARGERAVINEIVTEMNFVWGTSFRANSNLTIKNIRARLREGYTRLDFSLVINDRYEKWGKNPSTFSNGQLSSTYLRPSTVFSPKMENYLVEARNSYYSSKSEVESVERSEERSDKVF